MTAPIRFERRARKGTIYYVNESDVILSKICSKCSSDVLITEYRYKSGGLGERASICKKCESDIGRRYREENPEKIRDIAQKYYGEKRKIIREKQRLYHKLNPHIALDRGRRWSLINRERINEMARLRRLSNPEKANTTTHRRLARKRCLPDTLSAEQMIKTIEYFGGCAITQSADFHYDHVIPLATGHSGTVYGNVIPLRSDLNLSKNDSNLFEWFKKNKDHYGLSQEKFDRLVEWLADSNDVTVEEYRDHVYWCHENPQHLEDLLNNTGGDAM